MRHHRTGLKLILVAAVAVSMTIVARADDFPSRPVRIIVPFPPGSPTDTAARLIMEPLRKALGQPVILDNRPGASGVPGTEAGASAEPDGYTLTVGAMAPLVLVPAAKPVKYEMSRDFAALGLLWRSPQVFAVSTKLGVKSMAEFVAYAKARPGQVTVGSAGVGTVTHLAQELLKREAGIDVRHVPYRGTANSVTDLVGGHIDAIFGDVSTLAPHVAARSIVPLALTAAQRSPLAPDVPTTAEAGYPDVRTEVWYGLVAPLKMPPEHLKRLKDAVATAQADPDFRKEIDKHGIGASQAGAEYFAGFIASETARWAPIVKSVGIDAN